MTGQFAHWTRSDIAHAFDVHGFDMARIARMTGRTIRDVKAVLCGVPA
ncbi:hypothetical protein [Sulfitobacter sp. 1A12157]